MYLFISIKTIVKSCTNSLLPVHHQYHITLLHVFRHRPECHTSNKIKIFLRTYSKRLYRNRKNGRMHEKTQIAVGLNKIMSNHSINNVTLHCFIIIQCLDHSFISFLKR